MKEEYNTKPRTERVPALIISGGQTGSDIGGLAAAEACGIPTAGCMPKGFRTEQGPRPEWAKRFNLTEHSSPLYPPRTEENVVASDGTIIIVLDDAPEAGTKLTERLCLKHNLPCLVIRIPATDIGVSYYAELVQFWVHEHAIRVLNIAGNRESVSPGIEQWTIDLFMEVFGD